MPLTLYLRKDTWWVRGTVAGQRIRESTKAARTEKKRAEQYRDKRQAQLWERSLHGDRAVVTFEEAVLSYLEAHPPSEVDRVYIKRLHDHFGATKLCDIDQAQVDKAYRAILSNDAAPSTRNRAVLTPLVAILNHASRRRWCDRPNFERPEIPKGRTRWLTPQEAMRLEEAAADHLKPLIRFLLCTGARLSEALELDWKDVDLNASRVTFWETKAGAATDEARPRHARLPPAAVIALANLTHREGHVFLRPVPLPRLEKGVPRYKMVPYVDRERVEGGQIKTAFKGACRRAGLGNWTDAAKPGKPKRRIFETDVTPHVLRHTWATYFYALSKDLLLLRDEGGWSKVGMVERYAHLMNSEMVPGIVQIWGGPHPRIGETPVFAAADTQLLASQR